MERNEEDEIGGMKIIPWENSMSSDNGMPYAAHINGNNDVQTCTDHCRKTAEYAADDLRSIGLGDAAYLAGLLHDMGKFTNEFNTYIHDAVINEKKVKRSVIHSFAGLSYMLSNFHDENSLGFDDISAELIAYAIGSHHGLFDCIDADGQSGFEHRLTKQPEYDDRAKKAFFSCCATDADVNDLFNRACEELKTKMEAFKEPASGDDEIFFYEGMLARLLSSAVMDGDRKDTAIFMGNHYFEKIISADDNLWNDALSQLLKYIYGFECETPLQRARRELSDYCGEQGGKGTGIYRLNLPTGAGKTLSSMRFALEHARQHNKKRIFYVAPLISILEQNSQVIRNAIGREELVLEHHSNVINENGNDEMQALLCETWDAPIVITTMVQFMDSLFSGKTSSVRRMQSLCNSVVIFDEVQSMPNNLLTLFDLAMNFLSYFCDVTVVLCSATEPCLEKARHPMCITESLELPEDKIQEYKRLFKRTSICDRGNMKLDEIPDFIKTIIGDTQSILVVCNKKDEANFLYHNFFADGWEKCHLSSAMCKAHRSDVLNDLYGKLNENRKVICFSTQVIEAGVDISFETVIRLAAGMDSIIQSAGRCNRNGEREEPSNVYVIRCSDENLDHLSTIRDAKAATVDLMEEYKNDPKKFDDLASETAINYYYGSLYRNMDEGYQDDYVKEKDGKGKVSIYQLLSCNDQYCGRGHDLSQYLTRQAFKTAGSLFSVIDQESQTVIVPYGESGQNLIAKMCAEENTYDLDSRRMLLEDAKQYVISIPKYLVSIINEKGGIKTIWEGSVLLLDNEYYNSNFGLNKDGGEENWSIQIL